MTVETTGCGKNRRDSLGESELIETISATMKGQECDLVSNGFEMSCTGVGVTDMFIH